MNYEEAKKIKKELDKQYDTYGKILDSFPKNETGLTPDHIRELQEWKEADRNFKESFAKLRAFNTWFIKEFKTEYTRERRNRYQKGKA